MKTNPCLSTFVVKLCLATAVAAVAIGTASAQINGSDPSLRIWLKSDTLSGTVVSNWLDSSSWGTLMQPPPLPVADTGNDASNHIPQVVEVNNNGLTFQAAYFRQAYDPVVPDPTHGHLADRLAQANNLDASDPTLIDPSSNMTMIAVFEDPVIGAGLGAYQAIFNKRGSACPYQMGYFSPSQQFFYETYAAGTPVFTGWAIPSVPEWCIVIMDITAGGTMTTTEYFASQGGWHSTTASGFGRGGYAVGEPFTIAYHVQPCCSYYERFSGWVAEFALYNRSLTPSELTSIQNSLLAKYFVPPGPPSFATQPQSQTVNQFAAVTFNSAVNGTTPFTYQWMKNGSPVSGATGPSYSITSVGTNDAGSYTLWVTNIASYTNSQPATLTVIADTNPPTIVTALLNYVDNTQVTITFSELVDPATATNKANYGINNSVSISDIVAVPQTDNAYWSNYVYSVVLTTSPITTQSKVTANGITDRAGKASVNAQADIFVPVVTAIPPKGNLLLWLAADTNALTFGSGDLANSVYEWDDMSGTAHNAMPPGNGAEALPILGTAPFPNAVHPVLHFYGNNALQPVNSPDFYVQNFTVYLVGSVDNTKASRDWIGSWEGWCLGTSDGSAGVIKWVTHTTAGDFSMEPAASFMPFMVPAFIAGTFSNPGNKTLAVNGAVLGVQSNTAPINYSTDRGVAIGSLFFDSLTQPLVGEVAEILIYTNVSAAQDAGVQTYIASKYFTPSTVAPKLSSASSSAAQNTTVRVVFSGNVSATTAGNPANYAIDHGVSVSAATVVNGTTVNLTTSALNSGPVYNLTVNGVADWAGNALAANSKIAISGIPVLLDIQKQGTAISIKWDAPGWKLQSSGPLGGSWSNVTGASSPYPVTPTGTPTFYRLSE